MQRGGSAETGAAADPVARFPNRFGSIDTNKLGPLEASRYRYIHERDYRA
jgi:hypothetical protein